MPMDPAVFAGLDIGWRQRFHPQTRRISAAQPHRSRIEAPESEDQTADSGLPLGGIGTGGISWSRRGGFARWSMAPGSVQHFTEPSCGFAIRAQRPGGRPWALALQPPPADGSRLQAFRFAGDDVPGRYRALFPKLWRRHEFAEAVISLDCEAFSPVIPGDLESACLPVALFRWTIANRGDGPVAVSLLAHWANMVGWFEGPGEGRPRTGRAGASNRCLDCGDAVGILYERDRLGAPDMAGQGTMALLMRKASDLSISSIPMFDAMGDGSPVWSSFLESGRLEDEGGPWLADGGFGTDETSLVAGALAAGAELAPGKSVRIDIALSWDFPVLRHGLGDRHRRAYGAAWGADGDRARDLAHHALARADGWSEAIDRWHETALAELGAAPHEAGFALNELYLLVDGATLLTAGEGDGRPGHFALLECPDYPYYNTLDLYVYAVEAVARHFPALDAMVLDDYAASVAWEDRRLRKSMRGEGRFPLKIRGALPHDLGMPEEAPFRIPNGYALEDSTRWKDLNSHFVLSVWRAGLSHGASWLAGHFPAVEMALLHLAQRDRDGDGLIEHEGFPDQTFDNIPMRGPGSYSGGLWLAALAAGERMAENAGEHARAREWAALRRRGSEAFEDCLWTGSHYRLDRDGPFREALFLEQLFGPFLARRYGLPQIVDPQRARMALRTLYRRNFLEAGHGRGPALIVGMPADDGAARHGDPEVQRSETIVGIAMSFAAQCRAHGLDTEADTVRRALHRELHERRGLFFRTPAAYEPNSDVYRAPLNLRPLAIWLDMPFRP